MFHLKKRIIRLIFIFAAILFISPVHSMVDDFKFFDVHGRRYTYFALLNSMPVAGFLIINFTSVSCAPCKMEIPELLNIQKEMTGKVKILFIYAECCQPVKEHASEFGILGKAIVDPFHKIRDIFQVQSFPVTFVIGKDGKILGRFDGYTKEGIDSIRKEVR